MVKQRTVNCAVMEPKSSRRAQNPSHSSSSSKHQVGQRFQNVINVEIWKRIPMLFRMMQFETTLMQSDIKLVIIF